MLVGQRHLLDSGYVKTATGEEEGNDESKLSIEEQLAPWITTRNFINATQVSLNIFQELCCRLFKKIVHILNT